jgi:hypothetical protein
LCLWRQGRRRRWIWWRCGRSAGRTLSGAQCHARFAPFGLEYGVSFQILSELLVGEDVAVGAPRSPAGVVLDGFVLPPNLLVGALQATAGLTLEAEGLSLPFAVASVEQWCAVPDLAFAVVRQAPNDSAAARWRGVLDHGRPGRAWPCVCRDDCLGSEGTCSGAERAERVVGVGGGLAGDAAQARSAGLVSSGGVGGRAGHGCAGAGDRVDAWAAE